LTLAYAAPEVLAAYAARQKIPADPAQDIWALGVMAYECLTHSTVFPVYLEPRVVFAAASGQTKYPWETDVLNETFRRSRARQLIAACVTRDPRRRPTAEKLVKMIDNLGNNTTTDVVL
jgi:serine/threonine protein kinase